MIISVKHPDRPRVSRGGLFLCLPTQPRRTIRAARLPHPRHTAGAQYDARADGGGEVVSE